MSYNLIVKPKLGKFLKNYEIVGQMDPYLRITVGNETYKSDVASKQGKTPVWKKTLNYKLSAEQNNQRDAVRVMVEAFDDDIGIDDFIGRYICTLSDVRIGAKEITPFTLFDNKNNIVGTVEIEFDIKLEGDTTATQGKKALGTVVLRPVGAKFEQGHNEDEDVYLLLIHDDTAYQSTTSEGAGRKPIFRDIITFKQLEYEEITVQCFQNNSEPALMVGEGLIPVSSLQKRGGAHSLIVPLESGNRKIGELYIDVEFYNDIFEKPVRVYPILVVRKGEYLCKKFKYSNTDKVQKKLKLKSENRDLVYVKNDTVTVPPGTYAEVKIKIFAPTNGKVSEDKCRVDVIMEDKNQIEESLLFRIKAV